MLAIKHNVENGRVVFIIELYYKDSILDMYKLNLKEITRRDPMAALQLISDLVFKFKTNPMICLNPLSTT